jgi:hypothetical protein
LKQRIVTSAAGAEFSSCRRWRYLLWRQWDPQRPVANFLMLNPSTADEVKLDPTCSRAREYAERWGYGALIVTNIFSFRNTNPKIMRAAEDPVGPGNDAAIVRAAKEADLVVCAWGNHGAHRERSRAVVKLLEDNGIKVHMLRVNANGEPAHPLYLPGKLTAQTWVPALAGKTP